MSDEFLTDPGQNADGSALRKFAEAQKARADQFEQQLKQLQTQLTATSLKTAFDELKVPEKVRQFYNGEADPAKVKAWVEENKDVFNLNTVNTDTGAGNTTVTSDVQQQVEATQNAANLGREADRSTELDAFKQKAATVKGQSAQRNPNALNELLAGVLNTGGYQPPQVI